MYPYQLSGKACHSFLTGFCISVNKDLCLLMCVFHLYVSSQLSENSPIMSCRLCTFFYNVGLIIRT